MNNIRKNPAGDSPTIHPSAVIDPSAQIIGKVLIEENVFIGPLTVIRADERDREGMVQPIIIGPDVNIQDGVIIHSHGGAVVKIGASTSIAHGVVIHGPCIIEEECFLSMRSALYSASLEQRVWVGMGSIILRATLPAHCYVPPGSVIRNSAGAMGMHFVNVKEQRYMEDALAAAVRLREDYRSAGGHSHSVADPDSTEKGG